MANWAGSTQLLKFSLAGSTQLFCSHTTLAGSREDGSLEALYTIWILCTTNFCDFKRQFCGPREIEMEVRGNHGL